MPKVYMYSDPYGHRIIVTKEIEMPNELAFVGNYIIGVVINGGIYPLWSYKRHQVIVLIGNGKNVLMTSNMHAQYDRYFTPPIQRGR